MSATVDKILSHYESDNAQTKKNLHKILMHGRLGGTGKLVILPVDQGFEHGPARSFAINPDAYDPHYHFKLGIESGCSAYAAPLGALEAGYKTFKGQIPTILKMNSSNSLHNNKRAPDQAITASVADAVRLGCAAIGYTIYPGSDQALEQMEEFQRLSSEAKANGIASVLWMYVRGGDVTKEGELAIDNIAYGAHMGCLLGAHIIKVKLPSDFVENSEAQKVFGNIDISTQEARVREVVRSCFNGRRMVVFSGGGKKGEDGVLQDARDIKNGGGNGSIIGRNSFQRPFEDGKKLLVDIMDIYKR